MNDICVLGDCDNTVWDLCVRLGWHNELKALHCEIGGIEREWNVDGIKTKEDRAVEELTRELSEELKLDFEEDEEVNAMNKIVGNKEAENKALETEAMEERTVDRATKDKAPEERADGETLPITQKKPGSPQISSVLTSSEPASPALKSEKL